MKGAFKGTKRWKNPHLCSGSSGLAAVPPAQMATRQGLAGLLLCPAQSCRATGTWGHLWGSPAPSWSFIAVPLVRAVLSTPLESSGAWVGVAAPRSCAIPRAPGCVRGDFGPRAFPLPQQSGFPPPAKGAVWEALAAGFGNPSPEPVRLCPLLLSCQDLPGCSRLATRPPDLLGDRGQSFLLG